MTGTTAARASLVAAAITLGIGVRAHAEPIKVKGTEVKYPSSVTVEGATLKLTGTGLRKRFVFNVYTIASYIEESAKPAGAEAMAGLAAPKRLHIVMERGVDGKKMADALKDSMGKNHDLSKIGEGVEQLSKYLESKKAEDDDHIIFDYAPDKGTVVSRTGAKPITIAGEPFARALWDIYFGKKNVSNDIRKGLISRL